MKEKKMEVNCGWCGKFIEYVKPPKNWDGKPDQGCCDSCRAKQYQEQKSEGGEYEFRIKRG